MKVKGEIADNPVKIANRLLDDGSMLNRWGKSQECFLDNIFGSPPVADQGVA